MRNMILVLISLMVCSSIFARSTQNDGTNTPFAEYQVDLWNHYRNEIRNLSNEEIQASNLSLINQLHNYRPAKTGKRASQLRYSEAQRLWKVIQTHTVVGTEHISKYEPANVRIGYCFGRAMYGHLMLLKMGLQKESILKVWAIGKAVTSEGTWDFHVATLAYTPDQGWVSIDPFFGKPMPAAEWIQNFNKFSSDKRMRFYVTSPQKFSMGIGRYNPQNLGLELNEHKDWYKNYFVYLLESVRERTLSELGLASLNKTR